MYITIKLKGISVFEEQVDTFEGIEIDDRLGQDEPIESLIPYQRAFNQINEAIQRMVDQDFLIPSSICSLRVESVGPEFGQHFMKQMSELGRKSLEDPALKDVPSVTMEFSPLGPDATFNGVIQKRYFGELFKDSRPSFLQGCERRAIIEDPQPFDYLFACGIGAVNPVALVHSLGLLTRRISQAGADHRAIANSTILKFALNMVNRRIGGLSGPRVSCSALQEAVELARTEFNKQIEKQEQKA